MIVSVRAHREVRVTVIMPPAVVHEMFVHLCTHRCDHHKHPPRDVVYREANTELGPDQDGWCRDLGTNPKRRKRYFPVSYCPHCGLNPRFVA